VQEFQRKSPQEHLKAIAHRVRQGRIHQGLTQRQLAAKADISLQAVGDLERSGHSTLNTFVRVLSALCLDDLLDTLTYLPSISPIMMHYGAHVPQRYRVPKS
jgi:transcriptional regulator with XRE-family HTH domain